MPRNKIGTPNGVKLKKRKPSAPWRSSSPFTTKLGAVATSVIMPLINAATLSGIISRLGLIPVLCAIRNATGMKIAVTAVELIVAPRPQTTIISRMMSDFTAAGPGNQPVAEPLGDARAHQAFADHKKRGDQDDVRIAEARERLTHGEHASEGQGREHDQRHSVKPRLVDREHDDRRRKQEENDQQFGHCLPLSPLFLARSSEPRIPASLIGRNGGIMF